MKGIDVRMVDSSRSRGIVGVEEAIFEAKFDLRDGSWEYRQAEFFMRVGGCRMGNRPSSIRLRTC